MGTRMDFMTTKLVCVHVSLSKNNIMQKKKKKDTMTDTYSVLFLFSIQKYADSVDRLL